MMTYLKRFAAGAFCGTLFVTMAMAATEQSKKATNMLFEGKHISAIAAGTELTYQFKRAPSDEKALGQGFTDVIKVKIESEAEPGKKNVVVSMFSGERARDPNHLPGMDGNPMLLVFLDTALGHFQQLAGGDRTYLKNKFSRSIGDTSTLTPVKIDYKGAEVDGFKVTIVPYAEDPERSKMRGFEGSIFTIVLSDAVPGKFVEMTSNFTNTQKGAPTLVETMTLDGVGEVK